MTGESSGNESGSKICGAEQTFRKDDLSRLPYLRAKAGLPIPGGASPEPRERAEICPVVASAHSLPFLQTTSNDVANRVEKGQSRQEDSPLNGTAPASRPDRETSLHFLSPQDLRQRFGLGRGSEIRLAGDEQLNTEALALVESLGIRVLIVATSGEVHLVTGQGELQNVRALKTFPSENQGYHCFLCGSRVTEKAEDWTHLDDATLVPKTHPRIKVRGKLDALIASLILTQLDFDREKCLAPELGAWLADLRSWAGSILKAEVTGAPLPVLTMGTMDFAVLRELSHHPSRYLGHAHMVPGVSLGRNVAVLNRLRTEVREVELLMADLPGNKRPDLLLALNRMSSALYVLMLYTRICECGEVFPPATAVFPPEQ